MTGQDDVPAIDAVPEPRDAARTIAYRRSLRASRVRRATARLRRRRVLRGRGSVLLATAGVLAASAGAVAHESPSARAVMSSSTIAAAQKELGISADGIAGPHTRAAAKRFQRRAGLTPNGVLGPRTLAALGIKSTSVEAVRARASSAADPVLSRIAACESGGDPTAVSADGRYRGKYQFSLPTWQGIGGTGDPAAASEAEQDRLAAKLLRRAGTSPWPNCA